MEILFMESRSSKLEQLKKKQAQLKAQIQNLEAAEKAKEKKRDTRRKILIGAYYIDKAREDGSLSELYKKLDGYLTRESDKKLFTELQNGSPE